MVEMSMSSDYRKAKELIKNLFIIGLGNFLPKIVNIITLPIVTGYLTKAEYGTYDLISVLLSFILPIATLETETAAFRFLISVRQDESEQKHIITTIMCFVFITSVIAIGLTYCFIGNEMGRVYICLYLILGIFKSTFQQIVRGLGFNVIFSASSIINSITNMVLVWLWVKVFGLGFNGAIGGLIAANLFSCIVLFVFAKIYKYIRFRSFSLDYLKRMIAFSWPMIPNDFSSWVMYLSDRVILTMFCGINVTAVYAVANKIPNLMGAVLSTFNLAWHENASVYSEDKDVAEYYSKMFDMVFCFLSGSLSLLIAFSPFLFVLLIRGEYNEAYPHIFILLIASLFNSVASFLAGIYVAKGQTKDIGITTVIAAVTNLVVDCILVDSVGIWAASISTLLSYCVLTLLRIKHAIKEWNIVINVKKLTGTIIFLIALALMTLSSIRWVEIASIVLAIIYSLFINRSAINLIIKKRTV